MRIEHHLRRTVAGAALLFLVASIGAGAAAQEDERFTAEIDGRKTWTVSYGIGDALGLSSFGASPGQLALDQTLRVDLSAEALSTLTLEAHFDDQISENLQSIALYLDTERLDGVLGDFVVDQGGPFIASRRTMKGLRLDYTFGDARLSAFASRFEGTAASKTFVGETSQAEAVFQSVRTDRPWEAVPYARHLDGLNAYPLKSLFVEGISKVSVAFDSTSALGAILKQAGLGSLSGELVMAEDALLDDRTYEVIGDDEQVLLLRDSIAALLRDRLELAIDAANDERDAEEALEYPFVVGSDSELEFLGRLAAISDLAVNGDTYSLNDAVRRRYYDLGKTDIVEGTVLVEVRIGDAPFEPISNPDFADYHATVHAEPGIVELDFPADFFEATQNTVRVSFRRTVSQGTYMLGLSVIPGSDRVTVNGKVLVRDIDYAIDYEIGMVVLYNAVSETDVIRIDYERFASGLGATGDYARYLYGLSLDLELTDRLSIDGYLFREADDPNSAGDPEKVRTMPNRHTVAGLAGTVSLEGFSGDFVVGYNEDRFPPGDNARVSRPNEIAAIAVAGDHTFAGHVSGISVEHAGSWSAYTTSDGLSGNSVRAIAVGKSRVFLGTNSGLTVVALDGESPLDRVTNWTRYVREDLLPDPSIRSLHLVGSVLWIGTDSTLTSVDVDAMDDPASWATITDQELGEIGAVLSLASVDGTLFLGTSSGLHRLDPSTAQITPVAGTGGDRVSDLEVLDGTLYAATDRGLRVFQDGIGTGWLSLGEQALAVGILDGEIYYGSLGGLVRVSDNARFHEGWAITALAADATDGLWVGSRATSAYELMLWHRGDEILATDQFTAKIDGRDLTRYVDATASEHTVSALLGRGAFRRTADGFTISGVIETTAPGFRTIGGSSRSAATSWDLDATFDLAAGARLTASHGYRIDGESREDQRGELANSLSLSLDVGPTFSAGIHQNSSNTDPYRQGAETGVVSYQIGVQDRLFSDLLSVSLSWSDTFRSEYEIDRFQRENQLSTEASFAFAPSLTLDIGWARPIRVLAGDWTGSERQTAAISWAEVLDFGRLSAGYDLTGSRSLPSGSMVYRHEVEARLSMDVFPLGSWQVTPRVNVSARAQNGVVDFDGGATVAGSVEALKITTSFNGSFNGIGEPVQRWTEKEIVRISYTGIDNVSPSVAYSRSRSGTIYAASDQAPSIDHSITADVRWTLEDGSIDRLGISWRMQGRGEDRRVTGSIDNSYDLDLARSVTDWLSEAGAAAGQGDVKDDGAFPTLWLRTNASADYRADGSEMDASVTLAGALDLGWSETWGGTLSVSYGAGTKSSGGIYHSLLLELTVAIDF